VDMDVDTSDSVQAVSAAALGADMARTHVHSTGASYGGGGSDAGLHAPSLPAAAGAQLPAVPLLPPPGFHPSLLALPCDAGCLQPAPAPAAQTAATTAPGAVGVDGPHHMISTGLHPPPQLPAMIAAAASPRDAQAITATTGTPPPPPLLHLPTPGELLNALLTSKMPAGSRGDAVDAIAASSSRVSPTRPPAARQQQGVGLGWLPAGTPPLPKLPLLPSFAGSRSEGGEQAAAAAPLPIPLPSMQLQPPSHLHGLVPLGLPPLPPPVPPPTSLLSGSAQQHSCSTSTTPPLPAETPPSPPPPPPPPPFPPSLSHASSPPPPPVVAE
jgi:hypothetical protein